MFALKSSVLKSFSLKSDQCRESVILKFEFIHFYGCQEDDLIKLYHREFEDLNICRSHNTRLNVERELKTIISSEVSKVQTEQQV